MNPPNSSGRVARPYITEAGSHSMTHRKLIRPHLSELKGRHVPRPGPFRSAPQETNAEAFYYAKQMSARTPMVVVLSDGEKLRGVIEWYDRDCLKVNRPNGPNVLIPKHSIKYIYKDDGGGTGS